MSVDERTLHFYRFGVWPEDASEEEALDLAEFVLTNANGEDEEE